MRARIRALPGGRAVFKLVVAAFGGFFVAVGLVLVPLPGPGWAIVIGGLAIWAIEFVWARHLLDWVRRQLRAWTRWVTSLLWPLRLGLFAVAVVSLVSAGWLWIKHRYGFETATDVWEYITTH